MSNPPPQPPPQSRNVTPDEAVGVAIELYNQSRYAEAEQVCQKVLAVAPNHLEALHVLGLVAHRVGRDFKAVHSDVRMLANTGVLDRTDSGRWNFVTTECHVEFDIMAA